MGFLCAENYYFIPAGASCFREGNLLNLSVCMCAWVCMPMRVYALLHKMISVLKCSRGQLLSRSAGCAVEWKFEFLVLVWYRDFFLWKLMSCLVSSHFFFAKCLLFFINICKAYQSAFKSQDIFLHQILLSAFCTLSSFKSMIFCGSNLYYNLKYMVSAEVLHNQIEPY